MMLFILIPVFNEEDNVLKLSIALKQIVAERAHQIIVVDDCSTDATLSRTREALQDLNFVILEKEQNLGPGHSFLIGFQHILKHSTNTEDLILTLEADNTVARDDLDTLIRVALLNFDLVLASPYSQGGGFQETTFLRKLLSFIANQLLRFVFNTKVQTLSSFVRVYEVGLVRRIQTRYAKLIESPGFFSMAEVLLKAIRCRAKIIEVPIIVQSKERVGKSKMKIVRTTFEYLKMLVKIRL
jgi:dolichol-phosphate mannosyltransferase